MINLFIIIKIKSQILLASNIKINNKIFYNKKILKIVKIKLKNLKAKKVKIKSF